MADVADQVKQVRETFGKKTPLGKRRTEFAEAPEHDEAAIEEAMVVREPITIVVSEKGWIRALRGHQADSRGSRLRPTTGEVRLSGGDHVEDSGVRHQRPLLHHRGVEAAGRSRPRRAGALYADMEQDASSSPAVPLSGRPQFLLASNTGPRLCRRRRTMSRGYP